MDIIREHLIYKDVPLTICFKELKPQQQYDCIRLLLATRKDVKICKHDSTISYIDELIKVLGLEMGTCLSRANPTF